MRPAASVDAVMPDDKPALRLLLRRRRAAHVAALRERGALAGAQRRIDEAAIARLGIARAVACYVAAGSEVDPSAILAAAAAQGRDTLLAHAAADGTLAFLRWRPGDPLGIGPVGVRQPTGGAAAVPDLVFAPLLGYDLALARIGQGGGFYDRAFANHPHVRRIGLAWSVQEVAALAPEPWDVPLHMVITEKDIVE